MILDFNPRYYTLDVVPVTLDDPRKDLDLGIKEFLDSERLSWQNIVRPLPVCLDFEKMWKCGCLNFSIQDRYVCIYEESYSLIT